MKLGITLPTTGPTASPDITELLWTFDGPVEEQLPRLTEMVGASA